MKAIRIFDIAIQLAIIVMLIYFSITDEFESAAYGFIGLWQLFSFIIVTWKYSHKVLRLIYFLSLIVVFSPMFSNRDFISDNVYYNVICPIVALYYLVVCIIEYLQINKNKFSENKTPDAVSN
jgi:hypothetical protein